MRTGKRYCKFCDSEFFPKSSSAKFCCASCRVRHCRSKNQKRNAEAPSDKQIYEAALSDMMSAERKLHDAVQKYNFAKDNISRLREAFEFPELSVAS